MKENIQFKMADKKMLLDYETQIKCFIEYSKEVNAVEGNTDNRTSDERFTSLLEYFDGGKAKVLMVFDGQIPIGYAWFFVKTPKRVHLNEIAVSFEYQSMGIGGKLIRYIEDYAKENGCSQIELFCKEKNVDAKEFYENRGFETETRLLVKNLED